MHRPERLRWVIDQTVAIERLEGWQPTGDHIAALLSLVSDHITFGDYLAAYRVRYPPNPLAAHPNRHRIFRRRRPYLIPGSTVLRNNFGVHEQHVLSDLEFVATAGRIAGRLLRLADGQVTPDDVDVRTIHSDIFADVYSWAGVYRTTDLRRGDSVFASRASVRRSMERIAATARELAVTGVEMSTAGMAYQLARLYAEYNRIHPFREGNGRAGTVLLHTVATLTGRCFDLTVISRDEWYAASRDSMPFRRDGPANHRPFLPLFGRAIR